MFSVSLSFAIGIYITILLGIAFLYWVYTVQSERKEFEDHTYGEPTLNCPICGHIFAALPKGNMVECPQCKSLFDYKKAE